jgi:hypothetical protein
MRGAGGCGGPAGGAGGRAAIGACGPIDCAAEGAVGVAGGNFIAGAAGGVATRAGAATVGTAGTTIGVAVGPDFSTTGATTSGRAACGATVAAGIAGEAACGIGLATGGGGAAAGLAATGGAVGRTGAAAASFFWVMALSTSPGREICDKSILVLISSSPRSGRAERADDDCASDEPRMWARTFSASCSSSELEWVFFSVTPTISRASRMALLLTSSSLARSLIRTLLIRPFFYSALA